MYIEDFKDIVSRIETDMKNETKYLDEISKFPLDLTEIICDNEYINIVQHQNEYLQRIIFGEELYDWVYWYLYDRKGWGRDEYKVEYDGVKYVISDIDSFVDFANHALGLKMKPIGG
jgi:hypothetical protein